MTDDLCNKKKKKKKHLRALLLQRWLCLFDYALCWKAIQPLEVFDSSCLLRSCRTIAGVGETKLQRLAAQWQTFIFSLRFSGFLSVGSRRSAVVCCLVEYKRYFVPARTLVIQERGDLGESRVGCRALENASRIGFCVILFLMPGVVRWTAKCFRPYRV